MSSQTDAILNEARAQSGKPYFNLDYHRLGPDVFDCSGLVWRALTYGGGLAKSGTPTLSWTLARWCTNAGTMTSVTEALSLPACLLFMGADQGRNGFGSDGHVALTIGNGRDVVETPAWGAGVHAVGVDSGLVRSWSGAARIPGVDYLGGPVPPTPGGDSMLTPEERGWLAQTLMRTVYIQQLMVDVHATLYNLAKAPSSLNTIAGKIDALPKK